jgi:phage gp29-like protein
MANNEISKAVLGQTLTTEIGERGSYAAAAAHNVIREDIAAADRRRISAAFNRLAAVYTFYNFGPDVAAPLFQFVKDEDLQKDRADRDVKLHQIGWRPKKEYFIREYGMQDDDFDMREESTGDLFPGFNHDNNRIIPDKKHSENCSCGCQGMNKKTALFQKLAMLFASKEEKEQAKAGRLIKEFGESIMPSGQEEINKTIQSYVDALGAVDNYIDAYKVLSDVYANRSRSHSAYLIDEIRYASNVIGSASVQRGRRG